MTDAMNHAAADDGPVFRDPLAPDKIPLPSGGWALFRDPEELRTKHQKAIMRAAAAGREQGELESGWASTETLLKFLVVGWEGLTYKPDPADDGTPRDWVLPSVDMSILDELRSGDYKALLDALEPARRVLFPPPVDPSDYKDPDSPTEPASGSGL